MSSKDNLRTRLISGSQSSIKYTEPDEGMEKTTTTIPMVPMKRSRRLDQDANLSSLSMRLARRKQLVKRWSVFHISISTSMMYYFLLHI